MSSHASLVLTLLDQISHGSWVIWTIKWSFCNNNYNVRNYALSNSSENPSIVLTINYSHFMSLELLGFMKTMDIYSMFGLRNWADNIFQSLSTKYKPGLWYSLRRFLTCGFLIPGPAQKVSHFEKKINFGSVFTLFYTLGQVPSHMKAEIQTFHTMKNIL